MASLTVRPIAAAKTLAQLWPFLLVLAAVLAVGAAGVSWMLQQNVREQAVEQTTRNVAVSADAFLGSVLVRGKGVGVPRRTLQRFRSAVRPPSEVTGITVWARDGRRLASTLALRSVPKGAAEVRQVVRTGEAQSRFKRVATDPSRPRETQRAFVVWAPLDSTTGRRAGVVEVALRPAVIDRAASSAASTITRDVASAFVLLWLALALLLWGASSRLSMRTKSFETQSRDVRESARGLQQRLLGTVETLNAAVEARDPYTAGHSQRVRRVALAIGDELGLSPQQLEDLGTAALFHDVGKIGIPDLILTKTGPLAPGEATIMREHVTRGADIMSKVPSFENAVPAIRHHHERWDGLGYPDALSGDDIPVEAAIVGLADAWDAMTTDRPYAVALSLNDALMQIRAGRGKQFSPAIVDAFTAVAKRRPADILPPEAPAASIVVV